MGGNYQVCVNNRDNQQVTFDFMIQTGIEAKDYSNIITKKHLNTIKDVMVIAKALLNMRDQK